MTSEALSRLNERVAAHVPIKPDTKTKTVVHLKASPREKVGTFLQSLIENVIHVQSGKGCDCKKLVNRMNNWGIAGCEKNRGRIVKELMEHREILDVSFAKSAFSVAKAMGVSESFKLGAKLIGDLITFKDVPHEAEIAGANWLLDRAIEDTRKLMESNAGPADQSELQSEFQQSQSIRSVSRPERRKRTPRVLRGRNVVRSEKTASTIRSIRAQQPPSSPAEQAVRLEEKRAQRITRKNQRAENRPSGGIGSCFRRGHEPARFIKSSQLQEDIKLLLAKIPSDVTAIAGVARSGLSVATMLAMYMQLPMITIRQTMNDIVDTGNGWRLGGSKHIDPRQGKILVVDDTVMTGNSIKAIRPLVSREISNAVYAAVYVNPLARLKPDIWAVDLPWPHILEWNVFNSILSPSVAMDFDGILCHDCPAGSDDDGAKYLDFIEHAKPLYVPRRTPVPLIVTARIEKYRAETENWLRRHGIRWYQLVMHPAANLRKRQRDNIAAFKAKHYAAWAKNHRPSPGPVIFFESEDRQAREIARLSQFMSICPHTAGVY